VEKALGKWVRKSNVNFAQTFLQVQGVLETLPKGLKDHVNRTRCLAKELASIHEIDILKCELAAAAHDIYRHWSNLSLLNESVKESIQVDDIEASEPILLHGSLASNWLKKYANCDDIHVLNAVRYHTTGRPVMSAVEKVVFLADKVEPGKVSREEDLSRIRDLAYVNLDKAIEKYLGWRICRIVSEGGLIHPLSIDTWNYLKGQF
jgi:nicotinate-nucleotide adenylyltransferase